MIHKWCVVEHWRINAIQTKCYKKKITEPVAVPLDSAPERCTMTMKPDISTRASLIPILRPGPLLLSDTCQPTTGSEGEKCRPLDHMRQIPFVLTAQFR